MPISATISALSLLGLLLTLLMLLLWLLTSLTAWLRLLTSASTRLLLLLLLPESAALRGSRELEAGYVQMRRATLLLLSLVSRLRSVLTRICPGARNGTLRKDGTSRSD